ncbi:hydroxymethylbilane synthase [Poseidonibacter ostreae]|jgi:hydroxymethylbilane synthase|uniref:Porphobilinogen deaminase n=1 Tax=Poseidonibacter ostreae TaxID=2654171 RepID=A0A6L4WRR9_9BACT|nr:hydroxymethylbilane synthase [Poseidonibacter ostreae]KAB7887532.1 hydroxymethylbilane synthase [Poseidonibacter ostreae]KAB7888409.1 hydroxymethylbilane synthase [Poseidonibacter ostreae]KAB7889134.1 hydroxymethylbilane synthase [Poseidonibacter ostreae]MAC83170.1 hydroxymethylbilane synthase [Arcobacter sp.]|tara:strand:- start:2647 stop:3585 length:939 start_codon:yes stop_codon:yes gene_type:complete
MEKLVIATRRSQLALWQSEFIKSELQKHYPDMEIQLQEFVTKGDKILDVPLAKIGGKGLFTKELEVAMLEGNAHLAVHSLKDVPTEFEDGLQLTAVTKRYDPRDALLSNKYTSINELPAGAVIGTTSLRRRMALKLLRPDIVLKDLRGNINTRIAKLNAGEYDAIILAATGVQKLGIENEVKHFTPISTDEMIPSMGQATLGIETTTDPKIIELLSVLNDKDAQIESTIERSFVHTLEGGCQVPIGVKATIVNDTSVRVQAIVGMPDGSESISEDITADINNYENIGQSLAQTFIDQGAKDLLERAEKVAFK